MATKRVSLAASVQRTLYLNPYKHTVTLHTNNTLMYTNTCTCILNIYDNDTEWMTALSMTIIHCRGMEKMMINKHTHTDTNNKLRKHVY